MSIFFIADLHLSPNHCENSEIFTKFLLKYSNEIEKLYILGDFTNYWVGDDIHLDEYKTVIQALNKFNSPTPRTFLMYGNRDFLYGEKFYNETKIKFIDDPHFLTINNKKIMLSHGDLLFDKTIKYQIFRRSCLFLNKFNLVKNIFFRLSKKIRIKLANHLRKANSEYQHFTIDIQDNTKFIKKMSNCKVDILIHGHTHIPSIQLIRNNSTYITRYTLSDWHGFGNILKIQDGHSIEVLYF
ncbi:MAG: UDP-2,3-diacylglucosamine diphosphatase [Legionellales bacterium]|nr:UDP-2,3-diacylglucosamine diphosphatase [Legionellales bacterium]